MSSEFAILTNSKCLLCHEAEGKGQWQLCSTCRSDIIERSLQRRSAMRLDHCLACLTPKRG